MMKVGITGGIGSGKTTVCRIFELLNVPVYNADLRAKQLMHQNDQVAHQLKTTFGNEVFFPDGTLNRKWLAGQVFEAPTQLEKLNAIVHPAVRTDFEQWAEEQKGTQAQNPGNNQAAYVLKEAALVFETNGHKQLDAVILVWAPEEMRIARVMSRDKVDADAVRARMKNQLPENEKIPLSDFLIVNDGKQSLIKQVRDMHEVLSHIAGA